MLAEKKEEQMALLVATETELSEVCKNCIHIQQRCALLSGGVCWSFSTILHSCLHTRYLDPTWVWCGGVSVH